MWLTACTWWRPDSTCPCWTTQNHSWPPQERETRASRNSPATSLWADTWRERTSLNSYALSFLNKDISAVSALTSWRVRSRWSWLYLWVCWHTECSLAAGHKKQQRLWRLLWLFALKLEECRLFSPLRANDRSYFLDVSVFIVALHWVSGCTFRSRWRMYILCK